MIKKQTLNGHNRYTKDTGITPTHVIGPSGSYRRMPRSILTAGPAPELPQGVLDGCPSCMGATADTGTLPTWIVPALLAGAAVLLFWGTLKLGKK